MTIMKVVKDASEILLSGIPGDNESIRRKRAIFIGL